MTDSELEELAVKAGIYWVSEKTAYMHADTMRAFADALAMKERDRCAQVCKSEIEALKLSGLHQHAAGAQGCLNGICMD